MSHKTSLAKTGLQPRLATSKILKLLFCSNFQFHSSFLSPFLFSSLFFSFIKHSPVVSESILCCQCSHKKHLYPQWKKVKKSEVKVAQSCLTLCNPMDRLLFSWNSPGSSTGVGSHSLLQGIFPIRRVNPGLPHGRRILYHLSHQGSPTMVKRPRITHRNLEKWQ